MKIKNQYQGITKESFSAPVTRSQVIDAVVIQTPDLGFYLKMQNLINFFLDSLKYILAPTQTSSVNISNIDRCIVLIEQLFNEHKSELNNEIQKIVPEFLDEIEQFRKLLKNYVVEGQSEEKKGVDTLLAAKSSRIQWLLVCFLEEFKHPMSEFNKKSD